MRQGLILLAPDPAVRHDDLECFGICEVGEDTSVRRHHLLIMRLFREAAEENAGRPLYIPELCSAIGVPERTLQRDRFVRIEARLDENQIRHFRMAVTDGIAKCAPNFRAS